MTYQFLHIGKTGGTSIKFAINNAKDEGLAEDIVNNKHPVTMADVPVDDMVFFAVRDPVKRFVSGFYSRQRQGQPRYSRPWNDKEAIAFSRFSTPRELSEALARDVPEARKAMRQINHVRNPIRQWLGDPEVFSTNIHRVLYVARQETLAADWERLRTLLGLPDRFELPADPAAAHRGPSDVDTGMSRKGVRAIRKWYAVDYELIEICDRFRRQKFGIKK